MWESGLKQLVPPLKNYSQGEYATGNTLQLQKNLNIFQTRSERALSLVPSFDTDRESSIVEVGDDSGNTDNAPEWRVISEIDIIHDSNNNNNIVIDLETDKTLTPGNVKIKL